MGTWKDGKEHGLSNWWYDNGQKKAENTWKDGKLMSAVKWKPNGEKCPITNVVNGNGVKVEYSIKNGKEIRRESYREGELVLD